MSNNLPRYRLCDNKGPDGVRFKEFDSIPHESFYEERTPTMKDITELYLDGILWRNDGRQFGQVCVNGRGLHADLIIVRIESGESIESVARFCELDICVVEKIYRNRELVRAIDDATDRRKRMEDADEQ